MGVKILTKYIGDNQVEAVHGPSGQKIITDLPVDSGGKGRSFSPTDLFASSLATCILTIMASMAAKDKISIEGTIIEIEKHMQENPRKISKLTGAITFPENLSDAQKEKLLASIKACPVHRSIHPDIHVEFSVKQKVR